MDLRSPEELAVFDKWTKTDYKRHADEIGERWEMIRIWAVVKPRLTCQLTQRADIAIGMIPMATP